MMVRKSKGLSDRHKKIMGLLQEYAEKEGYPPSIREIGERTGISSTSVVNYYLEQLEKWGYIERDRRISRGLRIVREKFNGLGDVMQTAIESVSATVNDFLHIKIIGRIGASTPIPTPASDFGLFDFESGVDIARSLLPTKKVEGLFALEVNGTSMIDAMVNDGDIVIMRAVDNNSEVKNGEMVAIWLPERDEATLKYFYKEKDGYRLQPANPTMEPIMIKSSEQLDIRAKVVMVIRQVSGLAM
jgi:repressor LexA